MSAVPSGPTVRRPIAVAYAAIGIVVTVLAFVGSLVLRIVDPVPVVANNFGFGDASLVGFVCQGVAFTVVGSLLVVRRPANAVGWVMVIVGCCQALAAFAAALTFSAAADGPAADERMRLAAWFAVVFSTSGGLFFVLGIIFPTGHGPTPTWDRALRIGAVLTPVILLIGFVLRPGPLQVFPSIDNPFGIGPDLRPILGRTPFRTIAASSALLAPVVVWAMVVRYRHADRIERLQLRWFVLSLAAMVGALVLTVAISATTDRPPEAGLALFGLAGATVPIAIGIAILRYRLYEIDRIVSRTIGYAVVTALLFGIFFVVNIGLQWALGDVVGTAPVVVAGSTLVVAALFQPLRGRVQSSVDRRFHRARYDAERTVAGFSGRLRDQLDLPTLTLELRSATVDAVEPSSTTVWLRTAGRRP